MLSGERAGGLREMLRRSSKGFVARHRCKQLKLLRRVRHQKTNIFRWQSVLVKSLLRLVPKTLLAKSLLLSPDVTLSSQFSGMATAEHAIHVLSKRFATHGFHVDIHTKHVCDVDRQCQKYLCNYLENGCVFDDILGFTKLTVSKLKKLRCMDDQISAMHNAVLRKATSCVKHKSKCELVGTDIAIGGSPCVDYSLVGLKRKMNGPTFPCLLAWAQYIVQKNVVLGVHENVPQFGGAQLEAMVQRTHHVFALRVRTDDVGFGKQCRRQRLYHVLVHRQRAKLLMNPVELYQRVTKQFRYVNFKSRPGMFLKASDKEIAACLATARAKCKACKGGLQACKCNWVELLTVGQRARLEKFNQLWLERFQSNPDTDPRAYFHLNDNPLKRCVWSGKGGALPTLRKSMGPVWAAALQRPVTPSEMLCAMGWPSNIKFPGLPLRHVVGNAMHLGNVCMVLAVSLACIEKVGEAEDCA